MRVGLFTLIMLACVLCVCASQGRETKVNLPPVVATVTPSPTPKRITKEKRPNVFRRFVGWTADQVRRPFRKEPSFRCMLPPYVHLSASTSLITFCPSTGAAASTLSCSPERSVRLMANAPTLGDDNQVFFTWAVTGGTLSGDGRGVSWDLNGVAEGTYTATVEMRDGDQHAVSSSVTVTVALCSGCEAPPPLCPTVSVHGPSDLSAKTVTFEAIVEGGDPQTPLAFNWSITAGKIVSGQGTSKLTIDTADLGGRSLTATVSLEGSHPACTRQQASITVTH